MECFYVMIIGDIELWLGMGIEFVETTILTALVLLLRG